jgi:chemotaxis protein methyltransferase CheR
VRHFEGSEEMFAISPQIRQMVRWRRLNLLDDISRLGRFDVVLCRNVLGSLVETARARVLANLARALGPGGCLALGRDAPAPGGELAAVPGRPGLYAVARNIPAAA